MKRCLLSFLLGLLAVPAAALTRDDQVIYAASLDRLEVHDGDEETPLAWEGGLSASGDIWGLHLTSEGERAEGKTEEGEFQLRVRRALSAFWNLEAGWRRDFRPQPERDWAALGVEGALPYHIETELAAFVDDEGDTALRLEAHYEWLLTQKLVLRPALEVNAYGQDEPGHGTASGVSDSELGLRLRYEWHRKLAPYVGVEYKRLHGDTADLARAAGAEVDDTVLLGGLRLWY